VNMCQKFSTVSWCKCSFGRTVGCEGDD